MQRKNIICAMHFSATASRLTASRAICKRLLNEQSISTRAFASKGPATMRKLQLLFVVLLTAFILQAAPASAQEWKNKVAADMPLLGHRNWILIVDSAYPFQTSPGVETIETHASQADVVQYVLTAIGGSIHVRPLIYMDSELPF